MENTPNHKNLDQFDKWRTLVEETIQEFMLSLELSVSRDLNYSPVSLDILENWLLKTYPEPLDKTAIVHEGVKYYIGETLKKGLGGYWNVHFAHLEPDFYFGEEPVIEGFFHELFLCPGAMVLSTLTLRRGNYLSGILNSYVKVYKSKARG